MSEGNGVREKVTVGVTLSNMQWWNLDCDAKLSGKCN